MSGETPINVEFPVSGLLPKKETGAVSFLSKYPTYDGKGIVIAILDSGIDPGAPGMQKTSDGEIKVIERFDCSGCGDVNTSTIVAPEGEYITGLTGKKMKIPSEWNNSSGVYRIGIKNAFSLYPDKLKDQVRLLYKKKNWDEHHRKALSELNKNLAAYDKCSTGASGDVDKLETDKLEKEDLESKIEILNNIEQKYKDAGPIYDCILFNDGDKWMCCVNTSQEDDLSECPLLGEYSVTHQYMPLTKVDNLNFSINVHDNGDTLELVAMCSSHGTHVASIASAYFPDKPEQNGLAPGAQIVSLTVGDGRLGTMETGTAIIRAMIKIIELKQKMNICVINMSYGEHAHWVDTGRIGELVNEIVNKYGIVWVSSAGNNGPALSTISTPSDLRDEPIISVGAYVSPEMMIAEYAMRHKLPGTPYTWSSRGPTIDGGIGVHVCAPGGAITSVPNFTLRYSQLMNGTSMASPNCAGAVALLLSGVIDQKWHYSPYMVRRALENTALFIEGVETLAQGAGLIQVDKAFEYMVEYRDTPERDVRIQVQCGSSNSKGIYLRSKLHTESHTFKVSVEPHFLNEEEESAEKKINFNIKLVLTCSSGYVQHPKHLDLSNFARMFAVKIDTSGLTEGLHSTFVDAYDVSCVKKGPVFRIPITVVKPKEITEPKFTISYHKIGFKPNTIKRHYYVVPEMSTWAVLRLLSDEDNGRFIIHSVQMLPRQNCKALETSKMIPITSKSDSNVVMQVKGGNVLEIVIAKYWANFGEAHLDYSVSFYGVKPNEPMVSMHAADGIHSVDVRTLQGEELQPIITLKNSVQILKPSEAKISPLTSRDVIPKNRQIYELVLVYNFNLTKPCEVSPNLALLSYTLYESEYESQLWMLYDSNKQLLGCGDAYPSKYTIKLEKGDYTIRLQVRHDKKEYLDKMNDAPMSLIQKLQTNVSLDVYLSYTQALIGGKKAGTTHNSNPNANVPLYIAPLSNDKFPAKSNNPAHYLTGYITYAKDESGKKTDNYPFKYMLLDQTSPKKNNNGSNSCCNGDKTKQDEYNEALRDMKINWMSKLEKDSSVKLYEDLESLYPEHLVIHSTYLQVIDPLDKKALPHLSKKPLGSVDDNNQILNICNKVLESVKEESILAYIATKTDLRADVAKHKIHMEHQKNTYLECLARKGIALCRLSTLLDNKEEKHQQINSTWRLMLKFVDPSDAKIMANYVLYFAIWHAFVKQHYGRMLKYMLKLQEDKPTEDVERKIIEICEQLKWKHVARHLERQLPSKYPSAFKPF